MGQPAHAAFAAAGRLNGSKGGGMYIIFGLGVLHNDAVLRVQQRNVV